MSDGLKAKTCGDILTGECAWQILFICEYEQHGVAKVLISEQCVEFFAALFNSLPVAGVDKIDDTVSVLQVVPPENSESFITSDIPNSQVESRIVDSLDIKAYCWNRGNDFIQLKLVKSSSLACSIETEHQNAHLTRVDWQSNLCLYSASSILVKPGAH